MKSMAIRLMLVAVAQFLAVPGMTRSMTLQLDSGDTVVVWPGATWIVDANSVAVTGRTKAADAVAVTVQGTAAAFNPADGTWVAEVVLAGGLNAITATALNADANAVDSNSMDIVYVPASNHVTGTVDVNTAWSGAWVVEDTLTVAAERVLTIEPGTWVLMKNGARIVVSGQLLAAGTKDKPIHFTA